MLIMFRKNIKRETETQTQIQKPKEDSLFLLDLSSERCPLKKPVLLQCSLGKLQTGFGGTLDILLRPYNSGVTDYYKEQLLTCVEFNKGQ